MSPPWRRGNAAASESRGRKPMDKHFATAQSLLGALRTKRISARELLAWHLERIAHYNPDLHAIVTFNEEQAHLRAAQADAAIARGILLGPLHGLPVTIKDCIEVAGLPTTAGVPQRAHVISTTTAPVAQSVLDAGAVLIGKTNLPPYVTDWQTSYPFFGRTNNPWDRTRTPGGSTDGARIRQRSRWRALHPSCLLRRVWASSQRNRRSAQRAYPWLSPGESGHRNECDGSARPQRRRPGSGALDHRRAGRRGRRGLAPHVPSGASHLPGRLPRRRPAACPLVAGRRRDSCRPRRPDRALTPPWSM